MFEHDCADWGLLPGSVLSESLDAAGLDCCVPAHPGACEDCPVDGEY